MADTPQEAIYKTVIADSTLMTALSEKFYFIEVNEAIGSPYYRMFTVDDPGLKKFFCDDEGGIIRIQFDGYDKNRFNNTSVMKSLKDFIDTINGTYEGYFFWNVQTTGIRDLPTSTDKIYNQTFDALIEWSI